MPRFFEADISDGRPKLSAEGRKAVDEEEQRQSSSDEAEAGSRKDNDSDEDDEDAFEDAEG